MTDALLFDRPTALVTLTGPDAPLFLHRICTNDILGLKPGEGCEAYLCDARAKALFVLWVMRTPDGLWVTTTPGRAGELLAYLDRYLISERVELADESAAYRTFHTTAGPPAVADGPQLSHQRLGLGGAMSVYRRHDVLGGIGGGEAEVIAPVEFAGDVRSRLADIRTTGTPDLWETMRIEAGTPVYGQDWDTARFVMEIGGAARAVSYAKGCFPGQEPIVMARDRAGRVNRQFLGLKGLTDALPAPGAKLTRDGKEVGLVTSATHSLRLGAPLALGYVHWQHVERGTRLDAGGVPVEVLGDPPLKSMEPGT